MLLAHRHAYIIRELASNQHSAFQKQFTTRGHWSMHLRVYSSVYKPI
jgi:hypothetical protein